MSAASEPASSRASSSRMGRARVQVVVLASAAWLASLQSSALAGPPEDAHEDAGAFDDLPSPDELEGDASLPAPEAKPKPKPEARSSPPSETQDANDDSDDDDDASTDAPSETSKPKVEIKTLAKAKWIKHEIVPGERIDDIANRYQVRRESLIRWNKLDAKKPKIYAGRELAVYTKHIPPPQQKIIYTVRYGDTWPKIAAAYNVDEDDLRVRWNPKIPRKFKAGQEIVIWVDPLLDPSVLDSDDGQASVSAGTSSAGVTSKPSATKLPLSTIKSGSVSVGKPNRGKIVNAIPLPDNKALYTIRKPDEAFGSSHALHNLQVAIANFRQASSYKGDIVIGAISKQGGGRLKPHSSHQSGRDVDIRLPLLKSGGSSDNTADVDWDATWSLIQALVATGEVQYIFLSTSRQKLLYKAAKRAGASQDTLEQVIQYPNKSGTNNGIVRDADGHTAHFHVRFTCASNETRCESY